MMLTLPLLLTLVLFGPANKVRDAEGHGRDEGSAEWSAATERAILFVLLALGTIIGPTGFFVALHVPRSPQHLPT